MCCVSHNKKMKIHEKQSKRGDARGTLTAVAWNWREVDDIIHTYIVTP